MSEAVANAAKHAAATHVSVSIDADEEAVRINVVDNGSGFLFRGRYRLEELIASRRGPVTLKERVVALGGDLTLESTPEGTSIEIRIPFGSAAI